MVTAAGPAAESRRRRATARAAMRVDAGWAEAARLTLGLWLVVMVIYLPIIAARYDDWASIALDTSTFLFSVVLAAPLFAAFRATLGLRLPLRVAVLGACLVVVAVGQASFDVLFTLWVADNLQQSWASLPRSLAHGYGAAFNYACVYGVNLALFQLSFSRRQTLRRERQLANARSAAQQAQLEALRLQLNPHFLFNTLNAISAMIVTRRNPEAEAMTERLSNFLRASLSFDPSQLVTLEEELALIEDYLQIEQARFGSRLSVTVDCEPAAAAMHVPALLIQPLVENAIKYAVSPSRDPVHVSVTATADAGALCITVLDDGTAENATKTRYSTGIGLKNVRQRLAALYGDGASLVTGRVADGFKARICIPAETMPARQEAVRR